MMLKRFRIPILVLLATASALALMLACGGQPRGKAVYRCPMHPQVTSDKPGDCPICGMRLVQDQPHSQARYARPPVSGGVGKRVRYRSTINAGETSDLPGKDSMGVDMVPYEIAPHAAPAAMGPAQVTIPPEEARRMGLTYGTAEVRRLVKRVRTSARVVPDETRLYRVTTKVGGWVDRLDVNVTGQAVRKGQPLLTLYSPELVATEQDFLTASASAKRLQESSVPSVSAAGRELAEAARRRLELWDVSEAQIERLIRTREVDKDVTLFSPASGYVAEKNVLPGQKIAPGDSLLVVADLSTIWAEADFYESDVPFVKVGMAITLAVPGWPGRTFDGTVSFLDPFLDPQTRTLKARLEIANPGLALKPGMYGTAELSSDLGKGVIVPEGAVLPTGEHNFVFVEGTGGSLVPKDVVLGATTDGSCQILSGLQAGERVVTSATFLVDSESSIKAALEAGSGRR